MQAELSMWELEDERIDLLPGRETLHFHSFNWANVWASNSSMALNAASYNASASSTATQIITVAQS
jgi:hypothetical protein